MSKGYKIKNGLLIMNEKGEYDKEVEIKMKKDSEVISGDFTMVRSLSEKAQAKMEKKRRKEKAKQEKTAELNKKVKYKIDYSQAVGRKDIVGQINKDKPIRETKDEEVIIFELHREVVVDFNSYNLKDIIDYTLNIVDNLLNSAIIPSYLKSAVNTSLKALIAVMSINSIGKWINFLCSLQKILGVVVNTSDEINKFVNRLDDLTKVSENTYKNTYTIEDIYSNAFSDFSKKYNVGIRNFSKGKYSIENILKTL